MRLQNLTKSLSLTQRFMLIGFIIIMIGLAGIGWWIGEQVKEGVIRETAAVTALYMDGFISPTLQELGQGETLTPEHIAKLSELADNPALNQRVVSFKVWNAEGKIIFSTTPWLIGRFFPVGQDLEMAFYGQVAAGISELYEEENVAERAKYERLLEIYSPIFQEGSDRIIAVAEFYTTPDELEQTIAAAQRRSWLAVAVIMFTVYLLLVGFMYLADRVIKRQQNELNNRVSQLTSALAQNEELYERVRRATRDATTLNEHFLRRIGAELHDGPAQDISLAILRLDRLATRLSTLHSPEKANGFFEEDLEVSQRSLRQALQEVRATASGLGLPQIDSLSLADTLTRVVQAHERRTNTAVTLKVSALPEQVPLPVKIAVYRFVQEALNNAFYHAGGAAQQVTAKYNAGLLSLEVADRGPGFDVAKLNNLEQHLGLAGMRDRIECLEGMFRIESAPGQGTKVIARLMLQPTEVKL